MLSHSNAFVQAPPAGHDTITLQLMAVAQQLQTSCILWDARRMHDTTAKHRVVAAVSAYATADEILGQMRTCKDAIQLEFDDQSVCAVYVPSTPLYTKTTLYRVLAQAFPTLTHIDYDADWFVVEDHDCRRAPTLMHTVPKALPSSVAPRSLREECLRFGYNAFSYDSWPTPDGSGGATVVFYNFSEKITSVDLTPRTRPRVQSFPCPYTHELHVHNGFRV